MTTRHLYYVNEKMVFFLFYPGLGGLYVHCIGTAESEFSFTLFGSIIVLIMLLVSPIKVGWVSTCTTSISYFGV
jgi:hypothetical protein